MSNDELMKELKESVKAATATAFSNILNEATETRKQMLEEAAKGDTDENDSESETEGDEKSVTESEDEDDSEDEEDDSEDDEEDDEKK